MIITVNELCELCEQEKAQGNGHKKIYISTDDEGNGCHALFYGFISSEADIKELADIGCIDETKNIILLG